MIAIWETKNHGDFKTVVHFIPVPKQKLKRTIQIDILNIQLYCQKMKFIIADNNKDYEPYYAKIGLT